MTTTAEDTDLVVLAYVAGQQVPLDETERNAALRAIVWSDTAAAWARTFLDSLKT